MRRRMMFGKKSRLPSEYQEVEWIESGTKFGDKPYIDTSINGAFVLEFNVQYIEFANSFTTFGQGLGGSTYFGATSSQFTLGGGISTSVENPSLTNKLVFNKTNSSATLTINDRTSITRNGSTISPTLWIFATRDGLNQEFYGKTRIYRDVSITQNNVIVRNLIPCYNKTSGVIGMYDLISNTFFTNQGTGTFTKGNDVI